MHEPLKEEPIFRPTYRLIGYSIAAGVMGALAAVLFDYAVDLAQSVFLWGIAGYQPPEVGVLHPASIVPAGLARLRLPLVTTLGGLLSGFLVYRFAPEAEGHGTDAAIRAYHEEGGEIRGRIPFLKGVTSALTIGSGGVAGREGPTAQISVGLATMLARWTGLRGQEKRSILLAGMAAGLAAVFRAPLGMAIFSVEILYSGMVFESEALIYTVIAAVTSYAVFGLFTGWDSLFAIPSGLGFHEPAALLAFALLGVLAGVLGAILPAMLLQAQKLFKRLPGPPHIRPAIGGLLVGLMALGAPEILGTGYGWVELALAGALPLTTILLLLFLKGPGMALTIGSGGSGGVFAPTVTIGAMLGAAVGALQVYLPGPDLPPAAFIVVGMAAVFAGAARTPISTLIMVAEMTGGYALIVPAMLANILSFQIQRTLTHRRLPPSLYVHQVERREDSPLHQGVFLRRAMDMVERGDLSGSQIRLPRLVSLLQHGEPIQIADADASLIAVDIEPGSRLVGHSVADTIGRLEGVTAVAILREGKMTVPRGPSRFAAGDRLLAVATSKVQEAVEVLAETPLGQRDERPPDGS